MKFERFEKLRTVEDKVYFYIASLLCVGHEGIHTHLFQKNFAVGYKRASEIIKFLYSLELLTLKDGGSSSIYILSKNQLKDFIIECLDLNQKSNFLNEQLVLAGEEVLVMLGPEEPRSIKTPEQYEDAEAIVYSPVLFQYLSTHKKLLSSHEPVINDKPDHFFRWVMTGIFIFTILVFLLIGPGDDHTLSSYLAIIPFFLPLLLLIFLFIPLKIPFRDNVYYRISIFFKNIFSPEDPIAKRKLENIEMRVIGVVGSIFLGYFLLPFINSYSLGYDVSIGTIIFLSIFLIMSLLMAFGLFEKTIDTGFNIASNITKTIFNIFVVVCVVACVVFIIFLIIKFFGWLIGTFGLVVGIILILIIFGR